MSIVYNLNACSSNSFDVRYEYITDIVLNLKNTLIEHFIEILSVNKLHELVQNIVLYKMQHKLLKYVN